MYNGALVITILIDTRPKYFTFADIAALIRKRLVYLIIAHALRSFGLVVGMQHQGVGLPNNSLSIPEHTARAG
jgi:hypothetical protein